MIGEIIGNYKIIRDIRPGGMAHVYYAEHTTLKSGAAIKHLFPNLAENPLIVEKFELEGQRMAKIIHPNVVRVFDYEKNEKGMFLIMEYIDGLDARLKLEAMEDGKPMGILEATDIIIQVLEAFKCIHGMGIVHRDIKPANILISTTGVVKITDFGISSLMNQGELEKTRKDDAYTIPYMSPEQITLEGIGPLSDIYSIGVTYYALLIGANPYASYKSAGLIQQQILNSPLPSLTDNMGEKYQDVWDVISRATQKEPNLRYTDCSSFLDDIRATVIEPEVDPEVAKLGCTDPAAVNFNKDATVDDGSCVYEDKPLIDSNIKIISIFFALTFVLNFILINYITQGVLLIFGLIGMIYQLRNKPLKSKWSNSAYVFIILTIISSVLVGWYAINVKDKDHDGISDFYDACPNEFGLEKNSGCEE